MCMAHNMFNGRYDLATVFRFLTSTADKIQVVPLICAVWHHSCKEINFSLNLILHAVMFLNLFSGRFSSDLPTLNSCPSSPDTNDYIIMYFSVICMQFCTMVAI